MSFRATATELRRCTFDCGLLRKPPNVCNSGVWNHCLDYLVGCRFLIFHIDDDSVGRHDDLLALFKSLASPGVV